MYFCESNFENVFFEGAISKILFLASNFKKKFFLRDHFKNVFFKVSNFENVFLKIYFLLSERTSLKMHFLIEQFKKMVFLDGAIFKM